MNLNKSKIFIINLETAVARREAVQKVMAEAALPFEFFKAITPKTLNTVPHHYDVAKSLYKVGRVLKKEEIACACSHIALWHQLLADDVETYLILEDDIELVSGFKTMLEAMPLPKEPYLIRLAGLRKRALKPVKIFHSHYTLYKMAEGPLLTAGYVISKPAAQKLINYCSNMFFPIDNMMDHSAHHGVSNYCVMPYPLIFDEFNDSTIGVRAGKYSVKNTLALRLSVRAWRLYFSLRKHFEVIKLTLASPPKMLETFQTHGMK
jgi:glycosyl transferase, family 25